jgi:hypothetical protein
LSNITLASTEDDASEVTWEITLCNGNQDTLINVERLSVNDTRVEINLNGHAGAATRLLGAFIGSDGVSNTSLAGVGIWYFDRGSTYEKLMELAIPAVFDETSNSH